jgi:hypothetical protein
MELSCQLHAPATLPLAKEPPVPIGYRRLGGPRSRSERDGEEKNLFFAPAVSRTQNVGYVA